MGQVDNANTRREEGQSHRKQQASGPGRRRGEEKRQIGCEKCGQGNGQTGHRRPLPVTPPHNDGIERHQRPGDLLYRRRQTKQHRRCNRSAVRKTPGADNEQVRDRLKFAAQRAHQQELVRQQDQNEIGPERSRCAPDRRQTEKYQKTRSGGSGAWPASPDIGHIHQKGQGGVAMQCGWIVLGTSTGRVGQFLRNVGYDLSQRGAVRLIGGGGVPSPVQRCGSHMRELGDGVPEPAVGGVGIDTLQHQLGIEVIEGRRIRNVVGIGTGDGAGGGNAERYSNDGGQYEQNKQRGRRHAQQARCGEALLGELQISS